MLGAAATANATVSSIKGRRMGLIVAQSVVLRACEGNIA
jgi:hypothetical protein